VNGESVAIGDEKKVEIENGIYNLTIFLNGATDIPSVKNTGMDVSTTVYDMSGRTVGADTSVLPHGAYILKTGNEAVKIVK
jgi:hypothetical protein